MVVHQYDLMEQVVWCAIQHAVNRPKEGRECLIVEADHYAGCGQGHGIDPVSAPVGNSVHVMIYSSITCSFTSMFYTKSCAP